MPQPTPGSRSAEGSQAEAYEQPQWELHANGKRYLRKSYHSNCNASLAKEDVVDYATRALGRDPPPDSSDDWDCWIPYATIQDFAQTLTQMRWAAGSYFKWPSVKLAFLKAMAVTFERLVPGTFFSVKNTAEVPEKFRARAPGSRSAEGGSRYGTHPDLSEYYHGTSLQAACQILQQGFRGTLGAGSDTLRELYGLDVPGVYVAKTLSLALTYPMAATTGPRREDHGGVSGGTVPSLDPTCPIRVVFRCVAWQGQHLWHKRAGNWNNQYLYATTDLFVTHIYFIGVGYDLIPRGLPQCHVASTLVTTGPSLGLGVSTSEAVRLMKCPQFRATVPGWVDVPMAELMCHFKVRRPQTEAQRWSQADFALAPTLRNWIRQVTPQVRIGSAIFGSTAELKDATGIELALFTRDRPFDFVVAVTCDYKDGMEQRMLGGPTPAADRSGAQVALDQAGDAPPTGHADHPVAETPLVPWTLGSRSAEEGKGHGKGPAAGASKASQKRQRRKQDQQVAQVDRNAKMCRDYTKCCRIAAATMFKTNQDYYGSFEGMWSLPPDGKAVTADYLFPLQGGPSPQSWHTQPTVADVHTTQLESGLDSLAGTATTVGPTAGSSSAEGSWATAAASQRRPSFKARPRSRPPLRRPAAPAAAPAAAAAPQPAAAAAPEPTAAPEPAPAADDDDPWRDLPAEAARVNALFLADRARRRAARTQSMHTPRRAASRAAVRSRSQAAFRLSPVSEESSEYWGEWGPGRRSAEGSSASDNEAAPSSGPTDYGVTPTFDQAFSASRQGVSLTEAAAYTQLRLSVDRGSWSTAVATGTVAPAGSPEPAAKAPSRVASRMREGPRLVAEAPLRPHLEARQLIWRK